MTSSLDLQPVPYGVAQLEPLPCLEPGPPLRVGCYVKGCQQMLRTPTGGRRPFPGDACPTHGIRCHYSHGRATYSYADVRRNLIVDAELVATRIVGHPFKFESDRLNLENAEDALTWNVFRSLQAAGCLHRVAHRITGLSIDEEPRLYLWGLSLTDDALTPWDLLLSARQRFESNLPVERPLTEPDIALYLPGRYLIMIEAKFTSPNPIYIDGPRKDPKSLTKQELLAIYQDAALSILDVDLARRALQVHYQLWRNVVFAEWMARAAAGETPAYVANLVRAGHEAESCQEFRGLLRPAFADRFQRLTWEELHGLALDVAGLAGLRQYLVNKTAYLQAAFRLADSPRTNAR